MVTFHIGTQSWTYFPDWLGSFYPPEMQPAAALRFYSHVFDTVEVNATFHATPTTSTVQGWSNRTAADFRFALKLPRAITHELRLALPQCDDLLVEFLHVCRLLGKKMGPLLVQLPPSFTRTPANRVTLARFLDRIPSSLFQVALELRHGSWAYPAVERELAQRNVAWTLVEWGPNPRLLLFPADFVYVRWTRGSEELTDYSHIQVDRSEALDWWAAALQNLPARVQTAFMYVSNEFAGHAPTSAHELQHRLDCVSVDPRSLWPQHALL